MYEKALRGEIKEFTGITSPYEEPLQAELVVETDLHSPDEIAAHIVAELARQNIINAY